jgi:peptide/nickel transport system permease protein
MGKKHRAEWYIVVVGAVILSIIILSSIFAHKIAPYDPLTEVGERFTPPSREFIMGTNNLGFDVFSRVLYGSRTVLIISIIAAVFSAVVGIPIGLFSGYFAGKLDRVISLIMDSIYSFPGLILAIVLAAMLGPGIVNISLAIAVIYVPTYFRIVRGQVLSVKEELYVEAARSIGAKSSTILSKYIFPNVIASVVVVFSLNVADAILIEAGLSYLGLGLPPDLPDWGIDLSKGKNFIPLGVWWIVTFPGLMITLVALSFTMIGEGLSEILNPRLKEH